MKLFILNEVCGGGYGNPLPRVQPSLEEDVFGPLPCRPLPGRPLPAAGDPEHLHGAALVRTPDVIHLGNLF